jgi:hypothetical protein
MGIVCITGLADEHLEPDGVDPLWVDTEPVSRPGGLDRWRGSTKVTPEAEDLGLQGRERIAGQRLRPERIEEFVGRHHAPQPGDEDR